MSEDSNAVNFPQEAQTAFNNLLGSHGFAFFSATPLKVRYESKKVFVEIGYGAYDCEVAIEFGRLQRDEKYSFTLFLQLVNPSLEKQLGDRIAYDLNKVRTDLAALARVLQSEGQAILMGEDSVFERMKGVRWWDFQPDALKKRSE
jgi:hypothetical protein